jgi:orotate phosphoribosyltransferase
MKASEVLEILKDTGGLLEGHFELRSGLHSDRFFQCANVLRYPCIAERLCCALVEKMKAGGVAGGVDSVIAPALGGILVGYEIARALEPRASSGAAQPRIRSIFAEKQDNKLVLRRFAIGKGERVVVAEDVVTRGGRVQETIDIVKEQGGTVVAVAMLVDRSGGKARFDYPTCSLLEMEPVTWEPKACPLCRAKRPLVHPGS